MRNWALKIIFLLLMGTSNATLFAPLAIEDQVKESDGVIWGSFLGEQYKKLPSGEIVTVGSFKILKQAGLKYSDLLNRNKIDVLYPGGVWQGIEYSVSGSPKFKEKEEALLLVKRSPQGFVILNMGLGKYTVSTKSRETFFHSSVFQKHPKLGKISINKMNEVVSSRFNSNLNKIPSFSVSIKNKKAEAGRDLASIGNENENLLTTEIPFYWLIILFALMSTSRRTIRRLWKRF